MGNASKIQGIDKVFVLTVKSFEQRIESIRSQLTNHNIDFEFVFDHDIPDLTDEDLALFGPSNMGPPHKSLVLKNIAVWKRMCADDIGRALIFEDDAILDENFKAEITTLIPAINELDSGYLIFLGGADMRIDKAFLNHPSPLVPRAVETTEGLIIDKESAERRLQWIQSNKITLPADGFIRAIDKELGIKQFWPKNVLVTQGSVTGQFKTTLDDSRSKHGTFYLATKFKWDTFRKRTLKKWLIRLGLSS